MTGDDIEAIEKEMLEELKRPHGRSILVCPVCGSTDVTYYIGLKMGILGLIFWILVIIGLVLLIKYLWEGGQGRNK